MTFSLDNAYAKAGVAGLVAVWLAPKLSVISGVPVTPEHVLAVAVALHVWHANSAPAAK